MPQTEEQVKQLPDPASSNSQNDLPPSSGYEGLYRKFHQHNISDSTNTTNSNDSSPTTTISTADDSSSTEFSPDSSPESPPPATFAAGMSRPRNADDADSSFFELQKQPPPRKGRNLKGLAVNTARQPGNGTSTSSLPIPAPQDPLAAVLSPAFVKPPTPQRRKPKSLGLSIMTTASKPVASTEISLAIPPTPGFGRPNALRHFQSSPSLPLVPTIGLPFRPSNRDAQRQRALDTIFSPIEAPTRSRHIPEQDEEEEQNFDIPLSREEKPEAYPDGPICVYDPHIDLYLEPTAEQARKYDVIMNVASEVRNPFQTVAESAVSEPELRIDGGGGIQYAPKRNHLSPPTDGTTKIWEQSSQDVSPTTPKATPLNSSFPQGAPLGEAAKEPEYIHIPWEHNSDIVPDLFRLVKLMDDRVSRGQSILVHCQCGVSRSASLVVAYGLYKDSSLSVQQAYDAVKQKSKWIGPNMNLIMQLQEFRSSLARGGALLANRCASPITPSSALSEWSGPFSDRRTGPPSAALPPFPSAKSGEDIVPRSGPSSAPSGNPWPNVGPVRSRAASAARPPSAYVDPAGHVVPVLQVVDTDSGLPKALPSLEANEEANSTTPTEPLQSAEFAMTPVMPAADADPADTFGILSPTSTEFGTSPWDRSALLASLGMGSMRDEPETRRRSTSLRSPDRPESHSLSPPPGRRLRGKISSPTLREQQHLQSMQAQSEARLPFRATATPATPLGTVDEALMSPRATEFTENPFALALSVPATPQPQSEAGEVGGAAQMLSAADPRSPAHKGASPITRSIMDFL